MSNNRFVWTGLEDFKRALRALPTDLAGEASRVIEARANGAAVDVRSGYGRHRRSGRLQDSVTATVERTGLNVSAVVRSGARHAHLFEYGTQTRQTAIGANRGAMPAEPVFVPVMIRTRRRLYDELIGILERAGLRVTGQP